MKKWSESRADAPKGPCPVEHRGNFQDAQGGPKGPRQSSKGPTQQKKTHKSGATKPKGARGNDAQGRAQAQPEEEDYQRWWGVLRSIKKIPIPISHPLC